jgi:hypothetical protein
MDSANESSASPLFGILAAIASVLGLVVIGFGLWALGGAIYYAWGLFRDPDSIAYFARYFLETTKVAAFLQSGGEGLAHYLSWIAVILLLLVLGKLGAWAVGAGAQLMRLARGGRA